MTSFNFSFLPPRLSPPAMSWWRGYGGIVDDVIGIVVAFIAAAVCCTACIAANACIVPCRCACCICAAGGIIGCTPAQGQQYCPGCGYECIGIGGCPAAYSPLSDDDSLLAGLALSLALVVPATVSASRAAFSAARCDLPLRRLCAGICLRLGLCAAMAGSHRHPKESNVCYIREKTKNSGRSFRLPRNSQMATEW